MFWLNKFSKNWLKQMFVNVAYKLSRNQIILKILKHLNIDIDVIINIFQQLFLSFNQYWFLIIDNVNRDYFNKKKDSQTYNMKKKISSTNHNCFLSRMDWQNFIDIKMIWNWIKLILNKQRLYWKIMSTNWSRIN